MRSARGPGGREIGVVTSATEFSGAVNLKIGTEIDPANAAGPGVAAALRSASGEWSPLQQMCPELGTCGVAGVDSWHPEPPGMSRGTGEYAMGLIVQAA
jgi:hypothetical protein